MNINLWSKEEIQTLQENYSKYSTKELQQLFFPNRTVLAIKRQKDKYNLKKYNCWTSEEEKLLKEAWENYPMEKLLECFPNRTYKQLMCKARILGVKSKINRKRKGSLRFLDTLNPNSAYWWGFIMADGHLSPKGEFIITLSEKDKNHLSVLAELLNCEMRLLSKKSKYNLNGSTFVEIRIGDKKFVNKWYNILNYINPKTINPPKLDIFFEYDLLIYFLIGFIDGDGSIWRHNNIENKIGSISLKIELHPSWESILNLICDNVYKFYNIKFNIKVNKKGYVQAVISSQEDLIKLYQYVHNCNYMKRKWDKVEEFITDKELKCRDQVYSCQN